MIDLKYASHLMIWSLAPQIDLLNVVLGEKAYA